MKVIVKKPGLTPEICEVESLVEINKIVGNVNENGNGYNWTGSDSRMQIAKNVDMYVKTDAINNFELEENLWAPNNNAVFFGNIVFAGYDPDGGNYGECSLTDEQIEFCLKYIAAQEVTHF